MGYSISLSCVAYISLLQELFFGVFFASGMVFFF